MSEHHDHDRDDRPSTAQPPPRPGTGITVPELAAAAARTVGMHALAALITERGRFGERKYDTALRAHDGRDSVCDAAEEAADLVNYLTKGDAEGELVGHLIGPASSIAEELARRAGERTRRAGDPP